MRNCWGLDIGGTKCALVIGDETGRILSRWQVDTAAYGPDWSRLVDDLLAMPGEEDPRPCAIGVSCGGPLDSKRGLILSPPNLPGWDEIPIIQYLNARLGIPAFLQNDANACALAEWQFGAGQGCRNMVFLTFGTGLGAGLILDGHLYAGTNDMAGEAGHIRMDEDGPWGYGKHGSLEGFCSGGGLRQLAQQMLGRDMSAKDLANAADAGDADAIRVLTKSANILGHGLSILIDLLNPERIVIGSVYARAERWFKDETMRIIRQEALDLAYKCCQVVPAQLGDIIGDVAALTVAWNGLKEDQQ